MKLKQIAAIGGTSMAMLLTFSPAGATSGTTVVRQLHAISSDLDDVATAAGDGDLSGLSSACSTLSDDALTIVGDHRPSRVNKKSWRHLQRAMNLYVSAADHCMTGADTEDADEIGTATTFLDSAAIEVKLSNAALT